MPYRFAAILACGAVAVSASAQAQGASSTPPASSATPAASAPMAGQSASTAKPAPAGATHAAHHRKRHNDANTVNVPVPMSGSATPP